MGFGRAPRAFAPALLALAATAPRAAHADRCDGAVSPCVDAETFWPSAGPARFAAIPAAATVTRGALGAGLVLSAQSRPLVLISPSPPPTGTETLAVDGALTTTALLAWGVARDLQLEAAIPVTVWQRGAGVGALSGGPALGDAAMRDVRFGFAWAFAPRTDTRWYAAALRTQIGAPTGAEEQLAGDRGVVLAPSFALEARGGRFFAGAELGVRARPTTELAGRRFGTQGVVALGAGLDLLPPRDLLSVVVEARALPVLVAQGVTRATTAGLVTDTAGGGPALVPAEWSAGLRAAPLLGGALGFQASAGTSLPVVDGGASPTAPRFRFMLGVRYAPTGGGGP